MQTKLVIDGDRVGGADGELIDVFNPATGNVVATVEGGSTADILAACDAAAAVSYTHLTLPTNREV